MSTWFSYCVSVTLMLKSFFIPPRFPVTFCDESVLKVLDRMLITTEFFRASASNFHVSLLSCIISKVKMLIHYQTLKKYSNLSILACMSFLCQGVLIVSHYQYLCWEFKWSVMFMHWLVCYSRFTNRFVFYENSFLSVVIFESG